MWQVSRPPHNCAMPKAIAVAFTLLFQRVIISARQAACIAATHPQQHGTILRRRSSGKFRIECPCYLATKRASRSSAATGEMVRVDHLEVHAVFLGMSTKRKSIATVTLLEPKASAATRAVSRAMPASLSASIASLVLLGSGYLAEM
jgi:hypothetical protein